MCLWCICVVWKWVCLSVDYLFLSDEVVCLSVMHLCCVKVCLSECWLSLSFWLSCVSVSVMHLCGVTVCLSECGLSLSLWWSCVCVCMCVCLWYICVVWECLYLNVDYLFFPVKVVCVCVCLWCIYVVWKCVCLIVDNLFLSDEVVCMCVCVCDAFVWCESVLVWVLIISFSLMKLCGVCVSVKHLCCVKVCLPECGLSLSI